MTKIIGYFVDGDGDKNNAKDVFVAIDEVATNYGDIQIYCPVGQHGSSSKIYLEEDCEEITLEEYKKASEGLYTPHEYLIGKWKDIHRHNFEKISLDVAFSFDCDQDEIMNAYDDGRVVQFGSANEAFDYLFIDDGGKVEYKNIMLDMAKVTKEDLESSECSNVAEYAVLTWTSTKYIEDGLYVFIYE
jgi:hypothetical protein